VKPVMRLPGGISLTWRCSWPVMWTMTSKSMTSTFSTAMTAPRTSATLKLSTCLADGTILRLEEHVAERRGEQGLLALDIGPVPGFQRPGELVGGEGSGQLHVSSPGSGPGRDRGACAE
jgi:hypothetical protein